MNWIIQMLGLKPVDNAQSWKGKWTTWLSAFQLGFLALIALYVTFPIRWQELTPAWAITTVIIGAVVTTFVTVVAANVRQQKLPQPPIKYEPPSQLPGTD